MEGSRSCYCTVAAIGKRFFIFPKVRNARFGFSLIDQLILRMLVGILYV
ncbi:hypothetical protein DK880_00613 [Candidatus Cardinium hertigii]|uniref:Uncharacterized protein n=1 Tax=Candidatus Cardinium hertigii TaxID=247481 RepID=A0A2Z3L8L4_9BACT|nr:hypothetical protein DK880_00607 [Candidatus Cardinium hertigii]AWN81925.1 hypothetical protein DK880_00609 [Candidatus Cardinium hertigii]AWN81927.1 hypothetical protein DK880_00611 [Candidatus Cardinium hertigii]AWN81929.1 hypothetical protein DK880_00613 [Candidatus Cardinium hertigii]